MNQLLSIVVPCHNRFFDLVKLVESIPARDDIEVILVDDHSTEDLTRIELSYFSQHKFIRNDSCLRYAGAARNLGIEHSSGEYLFFADSDDLIVADGFLKCLKRLTEEKPDILFSKTTSFVDKDGSLGTRHIRSNWLVDCVLAGQDTAILARFGGPCAKFVRREFVSRHKIRFETQRVSNDIVFAAQLMVNQPKVLVNNEIVYSVRQGNPSLTTDFTIESTEERLAALLRYNQVLKANRLGYLMAPALLLLIRLFKKSPLRVAYWSVKFLLSGQPVVLTHWTLKNVWLRYRSHKRGIV
jgi:glycosyltransferase involved in cell wall biosynthesis